VSTPDRRKKKRVCHVNLLKMYFERDPGLDPTPSTAHVEVMLQQNRLRSARVHGFDFFSVTGCNSRHFAVEVRRSTHTIANVGYFSFIIRVCRCLFRCNRKNYSRDPSYCRGFSCRILYDHYLPTVILIVILIIIGIPSPTHSFTLGLNPFFFCKSSLPQPFLFLLQVSIYGFTRLFTVTSEHIRLFTF